MGSGSIFDRFWYHGWRVKNIEKPLSFLRFFAFLGCLEGVAEASWGLSSMMLARRSHFASNCWPCRRQDGEQERQDGEQERQDEPT